MITQAELDVGSILGTTFEAIFALELVAFAGALDLEAMWIQKGEEELRDVAAIGVERRLAKR